MNECKYHRWIVGANGYLRIRGEWRLRDVAGDQANGTMGPRAIAAGVRAGWRARSGVAYPDVRRWNRIHVALARQDECTNDGAARPS